MKLQEEVLKNYLSAHKEMIDAEQIDSDNIVVSFPLHFVGKHRVEVSVTRSAPNLYVLSDIGRTIGELKEYGYAVSPKLVSRMVEIARPAKVRIVNDNLVMDCHSDEIGTALHVFAEAAKTIGDAYLAFHVRTQPERKLLEAVANVLNEVDVPYKSSQKIAGRIDAHMVDFYIPPNGHPGLALEVLSGVNTHTMAQVWHFKCQDIKGLNDRVKVGLIYDVDESIWSLKSQKILSDVADFAIPSYDIPNLPEAVKTTIQ